MVSVDGLPPLIMTGPRHLRFAIGQPEWLAGILEPMGKAPKRVNHIGLMGSVNTANAELSIPQGSALAGKNIATFGQRISLI